MPWALSISEKKKKMLLWLSFAIIASSFLLKKTWYGKFSLSGCHLLSYFHHFVGERVTWLIQLIWISFAFVFSPFCWEKSDMADSAYLADHLSSSFHNFLKEKVTGQFQLFWLAFAIIFSSFVGGKKKKKQTWQIRVGCSDSKYMLLAYFFLGI